MTIERMNTTHHNQQNTKYQQITHKLNWHKTTQRHNILSTHHALHAMRKEHHQASLSDPLRLSRCDELINDALRCVVEVTKLSLPNDQGIGVGHREAQLKAQHCILREGGVADCVWGLVRVQVGQSIVLGLVHLLVRGKIQC